MGTTAAVMDFKSDTTNNDTMSLQQQEHQHQHHKQQQQQPLLLFLESPIHELQVDKPNDVDDNDHVYDVVNDDDEWLLPPPPTTRRHSSNWWNPSVSTPLCQQYPTHSSQQQKQQQEYSCRQRRQRRRGEYHHDNDHDDDETRLDDTSSLRRPWWKWKHHRHAKKVLFGSGPMIMANHHSSLLFLSPSNSIAATTTTTTKNYDDDYYDYDDDENDMEDCHLKRRGNRWWFWQDDHVVVDDHDEHGLDSRNPFTNDIPPSSSLHGSSTFSVHNMALALAFTCTSIATTIPMTLIPTMAREFYMSSSSSLSDNNNNNNNTSMTSFVSSLTSQAVSYAVLGTACGKFLTGWLVDVVGARRMSRLFSMALACSLLALAVAPTTSFALVACFGVEFFQAIQWPSLLVMLATHHPPDNDNEPQQQQQQPQQQGPKIPEEQHGQVFLHNQHSGGSDMANSASIIQSSHCDKNKLLYEQGIYITSLATRLGSLLIIPFCSWYLQHYHHDWRPLAFGAAMLALLGSILTTYWIQDAPGQFHQPQNPIHPRFLHDVSNAFHRVQQRTLEWAARHCCHQGNGNPLSPPPQLDLLDISHDATSCNNTTTDTSHGSFSVIADCADRHSSSRVAPGLVQAVGNLMHSLVMTHLLPSLRHVVTSGIFWMIAVAHVGGSLVRTSDRILATYYVDTFAQWSPQASASATTTTTTTTSASPFHLTQELASACSVSLSIGMMLGLAVAGSLFQASRHQERRRKRLVTRLYLVTIASCYLLALLSLPPPLTASTDSHHRGWWWRWWWWPTLSVSSTTTNSSNNTNNAELIFIFQVMVSVAMGFGIAVPYYQIPSLVIADYFGHVKGLASSYMDGVAYGLSSFVWHIVGATVANPEDHTTTTESNGYSWIVGTTSTAENSVTTTTTPTTHHNHMGWAYGWSAVALMVIVSSITMVEFMEHYFVRKSGRHGGTYETILLA